MSGSPSKSTHVIAEDHTREPSSVVVPSDGDHLFGIDPAAITSLDDLSPKLRTNPFVAYILEMTPEQEVRVADT